MVEFDFESITLGEIISSGCAIFNAVMIIASIGSNIRTKALMKIIDHLSDKEGAIEMGVVPPTRRKV